MFFKQNLTTFFSGVLRHRRELRDGDQKVGAQKRKPSASSRIRPYEVKLELGLTFVFFCLSLLPRYKYIKRSHAC